MVTIYALKSSIVQYLLSTQILSLYLLKSPSLDPLNDFNQQPNKNNERKDTDGLSDLVEKTKWILENYDEASKIGKNARDFALKEFTAEKFSERILYVWKNLQNNTIV